MTRRRVCYSGRVQGVGFRATAAALAYRFEVGGTVRNLADGQVEIVVEGPEHEVDAFLQAVENAMGRHIDQIRSEPEPSGEPFEEFRVVY